MAAKKEVALVPEKELVELKTQVTGPQDQANKLVIASEEDANKAADILHEITNVEKLVTAKKESITKPLMASLASVRDMFRPIETACADAKKTIKGKIMDWQVAEEARIEKEKNRIEARVEKGTMRADTAAGKLEDLGEAPKKAQGSVGKVQTRVVVKVRVIDETLIPREYLIPDMTKITEAVIRQGVAVPGIEKYEEKTLVSR